jgi:hypothetical protein
MYNRPSWDPTPPPLPQASVSPPEQKGGHSRLRVRGVPIRTTGKESLAFCLLMCWGGSGGDRVLHNGKGSCYTLLLQKYYLDGEW